MRPWAMPRLGKCHERKTTQVQRIWIKDTVEKRKDCNVDTIMYA